MMPGDPNQPNPKNSYATKCICQDMKVNTMHVLVVMVMVMSMIVTTVGAASMVMSVIVGMFMPMSMSMGVIVAMMVMMAKSHHTHHIYSQAKAAHDK
ncbi:unnamed protein product [Clonostachys chloroleuca]|uniref:Uncharacterized protein n=1 Tax=Clonostachys chloroleuca TaxID=1926264 RepID=A0AA35M3R4_9HYPO|nr:unnamed protein product [Clonostachys chloroleuca]